MEKHKNGNNKFEQFDIRNHRCYYFDDIIKIQDFNFDIFINERPHENILVYNISYKTLVQSHCVLCLIK